ncbi:MAG: OmpA family protein [Candidatus Goldbacteria bacterium]|nr:OmpA family protein [Candidatus Goldiibacteriota bacterium]
MKKFLLISFLLIVFYNKLLSYEIFKSIGARAVGIGGAFTSVADDYSSFFWNPAGLVNINKINTSIFFDSIFTGKQNIYGINYSHPLFNDMTLSATYFKILNNDSYFINDFFYFSFASFLHEDKKTSFGINLKLLNFSMSNYEFSGFTTAFDVGFIFFPDFFDKKMRFSLAAFDLDAKIKWSNGIFEKIPVNYKAGLCYLFDDSFLIASDLIITNFDDEYKIFKFGFSLGIEKYFLNNIFGNIGFRTGLSFMENYNFAFGFSYERKEFSFNYVFIPGINNLGQTHKLDFTYFIGEETRKLYKKETIPEIKQSDIVFLTDSLKNMEFEISNKYLSPNNDGVYDSIEIFLKNYPVKISGINWKLKILDKNNVIVKEINGSEIIHSKILWDGKDQYGRNIKDGDYTITYSLYVGDKLIWEKNKIINIDTTSPMFNLKIYPKIYAPVKNSKFRKLQINIDFKDKDVNLWNLNIINDKNNIIRKISGEGIIDKIYWDGDDALGNLITDGNYKIKMTATDFAGNIFEQVENIIIDTYITNFNMLPDKRIFNIGKEKLNLVSNKRDLNKIKKFDVIIYDYEKNPLKIIKNLNPLESIVSWNGTDEKNQFVKKGNIYIIKLLIEQLNGIEIEKEYLIQSKPPDFEGVGIQLILAAIDFDIKSFDIPADEYSYLNQAAEAVNKYAKNYFLILKGYAVDFENPEKNLELSINRVLAVYNYFITIKKLNPENIYLVAYGDGNIIEGVNKDVILKSGKRVEVELLTK